jgi:hypothetical protein
MNAPERQFVRAAEDVGNIVFLEHVNLTQMDQRLTTIFYVQGLGLTRDPYLHVWDTNMWINIGKQQIHSPSRPVTVLRGTIGVVVPNLEVVREGLKEVAPKLEGTKFTWKDCGTTVETTCPWGNKFRMHGPEPRFGDMRLGMPYLDIPVPRGTAEGIARFYEQIMLVPSRRELGKFPAAHIGMGAGQVVIYRETDDHRHLCCELLHPAQRAKATRVGVRRKRSVAIPVQGHRRSADQEIDVHLGTRSAQSHAPDVRAPAGESQFGAAADVVYAGAGRLLLSMGLIRVGTAEDAGDAEGIEFLRRMKGEPCRSLRAS